MLSLERIRKNKQIKETEEQKRKENYKSPSGSVIIGRFMKSYQLQIINEFSKENNLSESKTNELITRFHKLNYYMPIVTRYHKNERVFLENSLPSLS